MFASALAGTIAYPQIDPILVQLGPLAIRWYSLAYIAGLLFGWWFIRRQSLKPGAAMSAGGSST